VRAYVESSVLLRLILAEPEPLASWGLITDPITSELTRIECLRTLDRSRFQGRITERTLARARGSVLQILEEFTIVELDERIKSRAADPFPTLVRTLDAIHLATAIVIRGPGHGLAFATHDRELGVAAESFGFDLLD
jgi:predicted nucleic acid-binding protein